MERLLYGFDMRTLRPVEVMKQLRHRPVLLIYGGQEITPERCQLVVDALPEADLWIVAGAAHTGAYTAVPQAYLDRGRNIFREEPEMIPARNRMWNA